MAVQRRATAENGDIELELSVTAKSPLVISARAPEATPSRQWLDSVPMSPPPACSTLSISNWSCSTRSDYLHRLLGCIHTIDRHHRGDIDSKVIATRSKRQVNTSRAAVAGSVERFGLLNSLPGLLQTQAEPFGQSSCTCRKATNSSSANSPIETRRRSLAWHAECFMRVMFQTRFMAIQFLVKKADREMMRHLRFALPGLRQEKEEPQSKRKNLAWERNVPIGQPPGQGGVDSRPAASMRERDRKQIGTEQMEFQETPIAFDQRGHFHPTGQRR